MIHITHHFSGAFAALVLVLLIPLESGCSSAEDRALYHLERGRAFATNKKFNAAEIEFRNALRFDPKNLSANLELADLSEDQSNPKSAIFYLRDALAAEPENSAIAIRLATLLRDKKPWRARQLLLSVLERDPENATGQLGLSHIELSLGRRDEALAIAKHAIELDPGVPGAYWQLGIAYEAILELALIERAPIDEALRSAAVDAFENFVATGGEPEWKARIEQARILSTGSHNQGKALASARLALKSALQTELDQPKLIAAEHLAKIARMQHNRAALAESTEGLLKVTPRNFRAWRRLAELREASGSSAEAVYQDLLSLFPDDPEVHVLYARHIGVTQGVWSAIRYFDQQIELGIDGAHLLSALRSYQLTYHLKPQAERTLARLLEEYPDDPWTQFEVAKESAAQGHSLAAIASLKNLLQAREISEAFEVLAKLERFHHHVKRAMWAARNAVMAKGYYDPRQYTLLAETLFEGGQFVEYLEILEKIARHTDLTPEQRLTRAQSLYATGDTHSGRKILLELIELPTVTVEATVEFARREAGDPKQLELARKLLRTAIMSHPENRDLSVELIDLNLRSGRPDIALRMLEALDITKHSANVRYIRARLRSENGNFTGALADVNLALRADPLLPDLIDFALLLYSQDSNTKQHVTLIKSWLRIMRSTPRVDSLTNSRRLAQLHLLHSRLMHVKGRTDEALAILEAAISNHEFTIDTRIDLAYLLAANGSDIDRAISIARNAVSKQKTNPRALHALGFAYLRDENPLDAFENLRLANQRSTSPNPLFRYHESIALEQMGRDREALELIDTVLAIDPNFPQAVELRRDLMAAVADESQPS